jgi:FixJ family two-component response regulator
MTEEKAVVFVVDDDLSMRDSVESLVRSVGLKVHSFGSAREFLQIKRPDAPGCLVLDVRLPGESGLDLQHELVKSHVDRPVIFKFFAIGVGRNVLTRAAVDRVVRRAYRPWL